MSGDYIVEFAQVGAAVKVTAIDPVSGQEVSIVGDPAVGQQALSRLAVQKLIYVLNRSATPQSEAPAVFVPGKGIKV